MIIIYEDDKICVKYFYGDGSKKELKITFNSHIPEERLSIVDTHPLRGGWEEEIIRLNAPAIFFIEKSNVWFNFRNIHEILMKVLVYRKQFDSCTLFGASLGGYAALKFSKYLLANQVLAISPQYCIQKDNVFFENRWRKDIDKIVFFDDLIISDATVSGDIYIMVDSNHLIDNEHVQLIKENVKRANVILLPDSGHSSAKALFDLGLIDVILNITKDNVEENIQSLISIYNSDKLFSPTVIKVMAGKLTPSEAIYFIENRIATLKGFKRHRDELDAYLKKLKNTT